MLIDIRWLRFLLNHWRHPIHPEEAAHQSAPATSAFDTTPQAA